MAAIGCDGKVAYLIGEEVAVDFVDGHENKVCAGVVGFFRDILHGVIEDVRHPKSLGCWIWLSGLDTLAILIHVSHFRF